MPYDASYEDFFSDYLDLSRRYCEAVADLTALGKEGDHGPFVKAAFLARELAGQVATARDKAVAHRPSACDEIYP